MTAMRRQPRLLEGIRTIAGRLLLGVFVLAAQLAPLAHLATHRNDHTHGPEAAPRTSHDHDDDHDHDHGHDADHTDSPEHDHDGGAPPEPTSREHGRTSAAHFDLALLDGPPPPFLPPPAETLAPAPDVIARWHHAPALPQPPARGPPSSH